MKFLPFKGRSAIVPGCSVPPRTAVVVSTSGTSSVTVTFSEIAPGSREKSIFSSRPTSNTTFGRSMLLKPVSSARIRYVPGRRLGALYAPASSVVRTRDVPLSTSVTVTLAPPMTAPDESVMLPRIRPIFACENTGTEIRNTERHRPRTTFGAELRRSSRMPNVKEYI